MHIVTSGAGAMEDPDRPRNIFKIWYTIVCVRQIHKIVLEALLSLHRARNVIYATPLPLG